MCCPRAFPAPYPIRPDAAGAQPPRVLIAEDDPVSCTVLERTLRGWGHEVVVTRTGNDAWEGLLAQTAPRLAILDWMMPGLEGPEVCRRVRALAQPIPTYIILLTARGQTDDIVAGLESGADDYVTKPFDRQELRSRLRVGERILSLQQGTAEPRPGTGSGPRPGEGIEGIAPDLLLLQGGAGRSELLAPGGNVHHGALGGPVQPRHLPRLLEGRCRARTGRPVELM